MELSGKVSKKARAAFRKRKLGEVIANIRISSPEFSAADNLSRDTMYEEARTNPGSIYSGELAKDDDR